MLFKIFTRAKYQCSEIDDIFAHRSLAPLTHRVKVLITACAMCMYLGLLEVIIVIQEDDSTCNRDLVLLASCVKGGFASMALILAIAAWTATGERDRWAATKAAPAGMIFGGGGCAAAASAGTPPRAPLSRALSHRGREGARAELGGCAKGPLCCNEGRNSTV